MLEGMKLTDTWRNQPKYLYERKVWFEGAICIKYIEIGVEKKRTLNAIEQIKPVLNID